MGAAGSTGERIVRGLGLLALCAILTGLLQSWVGDFTVYAGYDEARLRLHEAILSNRLPPKTTWHSIGGNGINIRILAVYLAEAVHRTAGAPLLDVYRAMDSLALFALLVGFTVYLRRWFDDAICLIGLLYFSLAAVLSYHFFYFHPWDRLSQLVWLLLLVLLLEGRTALLGLALAVAMTLKYDVVFFPALYFLYRANRRVLPRVAGETALLFGITVGVYAALRMALPGGFDREGFGSAAGALAQLERNWRHLRVLGLSYPPLLAFALPSALAWWHLRGKDRFFVASTVFAHALFAVHFALSNFREVRALLYLLILLLPPALCSLRGLLRGEPAGPPARR